MIEIVESVAFGTAVAIGCIAVPAVVSAWCKGRKVMIKTPGKDADWKLVGSLASITLYPMKSGKGVDLLEANCTQLGLSQSRTDDKFILNDRFFILYREDNGDMITALTLPNILQISITPETSNSVRLSYPNKPDFSVVIPKGGSKVTQMWRKEKVECWDCGDEASSWLTEILRGPNADNEKRIRLGYWPQSGVRRNIVGTYKELYNDKVFKGVTNMDSGAYSDITSYLLMTSSSMDELNRRLNGLEVTPSQFRPNFYVQTEEPPFSDLNWKWVRIGDNVFKFVKGCVRCALVTYKVNGEKCKNDEPLRTLKRMDEAKSTFPIKQSPMMGIHLGLSDSGTVRVGDAVYIIM